MNKHIHPRADLSELEIKTLPQVLPDPDEVSYLELEKMRRIYLDYDVSYDVLAIQRLILRWNIEDAGIPPEERHPIWLLIHSYGGSLDFMWDIVDAITTSITPVYTVNLGEASSAASLIFISGKKRFMMPHASVTIHEGSAQMAGDAVKVLDASEGYRKELKLMKEYILAHTSIPKAQLMKKRNNDWELDANYCLQNGVCDQIVGTIGDLI